MSFFLVNSIDPTRTLTIRNQFVMDFNRRFRMLMSDIREMVVDLDVFGLTTPVLQGAVLVANRQDVTEKAFDFPLMADKVDAFTDWLKRKNNTYFISGGRRGIQTIFQPEALDDYRTSWMNTYIDSSYQQGIRRGRQELRKKGVKIDEGLAGGDPIRVAFNMPIHADRVGLIYSRAYTSLKGITSGMESTVSDVLAIGLADGKHPRQIAQMLNFAITGQGGDLGIKDSLGRFIPAKRRAQVLARTETVRAHHAANMGEYRAAGVLGIEIMAEHLTAGDSRVCPQCAPLNGKRYTLTEAEYMIPVHPQCRCVAIPYIPDDESTPKSEIEIKGIGSFSPKQQDAIRVGVNVSAQKYKGENQVKFVRADSTQKAVARYDYADGGGVVINPDLFNDDYININNNSIKKSKRRASHRIEMLQQELKDNSGVYGDDEINTVKRQIKRYENKLSEPDFVFSIANDISETIIHETGHGIHGALTRGEFADIVDFLPPSKLRDLGVDFKSTLQSRLDFIASSAGSSVSEYATTNAEEYFAESWVKYIKGDESGVDKALLRIFKKVTR